MSLEAGPMTIGIAGGVIRDGSRIWLGAFTRNIGRCILVLVKHRCVLSSLTLDWSLGFWQVEHGMDFLIIINTLFSPR